MAESAKQPEGSSVTKAQDVNPWSVSGEVNEDGTVKPINYSKLVEQFGTKLIDEALLERFERVTGHKPHQFLRRQIVFSHRDLEVILDRYSRPLSLKTTKLTLQRFEKKEPFFIYTGRGPSSNIMHIGHMVPFQLTKWLSDVFQVPVIIMLTDGEFKRYHVTIFKIADNVNDQTKNTLLVKMNALWRNMKVTHERMLKTLSLLASIPNEPSFSRILNTWGGNSIETSHG